MVGSPEGAESASNINAVIIRTMLLAFIIVHKSKTGFFSYQIRYMILKLE